MAEDVDYPIRDQIEFFRSAMKGHSKVLRCETEDGQIFRLERTMELTPITCYLTNLYAVGEADVIRVAALGNDVDCIVTMSAWNGYTRQAKEFARGRKMGLFTFREFMGALHWAKFWAYAAKDEDGNATFAYK
jgi:hypothetical protein